MSKFNTIKAKHDELYADYNAYLDSPDADLEVANKMEAEFEAVKAELAEAQRHEGNRTRYRSEIAQLSKPNAVPFGFENSRGNGIKSIAGEIVGSDSFKSYRPGDRRTAVFEVKATLSRSGLANYDQYNEIIESQKAPLGFSDLFSQSGTTGTSVRIIREASYTNYAAPTSEGLAKPAATTPVEQVTFPVEKIAVVEKVTDEMLADYLETQSFLSNVLTYSVRGKKDDQSCNGSGNTPEITGLLNTSGIQTQAKSSDTAVDAIYKAIIKCQNGGYGYVPDFIVMNPTDWQAIRISKASTSGDYLLGGPALQAANVLWGMPVILLQSLAAGTAIVGAFKMGGTFYTREGIRVEFTNSNEDDFNKNLVSVRVETRGALAIKHPKAFCKVTGL